MKRHLIKAVLVLLVFASNGHAGDAPILKVGEWGIGKIDDRFMLYLGAGRALFTPIPSGRKWVAAYALLAALIVTSVIVRRRFWREAAVGRGFEVRPASPTGNRAS